MARNTRKEKEKVFKRRIHLPLQWQEVIGVKGKDYNKEMKLQFQAIWVSGSTLHLFCSFATLVALLCNLCMHRLFKKMKHAEKSIANCSHSIKCCIDRDQGLLQAKHGMKMTGWKGHQENIWVVKQSLLETVYFTPKMCISRDLELYYIKWSLSLY